MTTQSKGRILKCTLSQQGGAIHEIKLRTDMALYIGRADKSLVRLADVAISSQHVQLSAKAVDSNNQDLALWARNVGRNGTGIRYLQDDGTLGQVRHLKDTDELVKEGCELVVPYKQKENEETDSRFYFKVSMNSADDQVPQLPAKSKTIAEKVKEEVKEDDAEAEPPCLAVVISNKELDLANLPDVYDPVTQKGRWRYDARLGEGGLGVVYRAYDVTGPHENVAIKIHKARSKQSQKDARFVFELHRESQWSKWYLHNEFSQSYDKSKAERFARYVEDQTGFAGFGPDGFDKKRRAYEATDFDWDKDGPEIPERPYVVMELVTGEPLHTVIDREFYPSKKKGSEAVPPVLSVAEKHEVLLQAAQALEYLAPFGLIHRDFRGCNMHLVSRKGPDTSTQLKVLDLGIMIRAEDGQEYNSNQAVQAFQRKGMDEDKKRRYDWLPWEVRKGADGTGPAVNFSPPAHSFDVFSLGVLALHMTIGRTKTRDFLDSLRHNAESRVDSNPIGLDPEVLVSMLHDAPEKRPTPRQVCEALLQNSKSENLPRRVSSRSRSRSREYRNKVASARSDGMKAGSQNMVPIVPASGPRVLSGSGSRSKAWITTLQLDRDHPMARML